MWTREVDLTSKFTTGYAAGDTIVFGVAGENPVDVLNLATDQGDNYSQEERRLHGFSAKNGEPLWVYASGGASQVVGMDADHVVVRVSVLNPASNTISNLLTVLDAREGGPLWAVNLPASSPTNHERARLLIPGLAEQGLEVVDVHTGESRTVLSGVTVLGATADGTSIGVETLVSVGELLVLYDRAG